MDMLARIQQALDQELTCALSPSAPPRLMAAMRHAVFPGGARIRPQLCLAVAQACGDDAPELTDAAAVAIELLHCASLVHDDMPCFDDADLRRGLPTVHRKWDEATAILAGDALQRRLKFSFLRWGERVGRRYLCGNLATMLGNFLEAKPGDPPCRLQLGTAWWFMDTKEGMEWQINTFSNTSLLSRFNGMLTDSRSFLSFTRHEYFRRILCNMIGTDIENGEMVVIDEADTVQEGPAPHGKIGQSTAWRISDTLIQPAVHSRVYRHSRTLIARAYKAANATAPGAARVCRYSM